MKNNTGKRVERVNKRGNFLQQLGS